MYNNATCKPKRVKTIKQFKQTKLYHILTYLAHTRGITHTRNNPHVQQLKKLLYLRKKKKKLP